VNSTNLAKTEKQPSVLSDAALGNLRYEKLTSTQGEGMTEPASGFIKINPEMEESRQKSAGEMQCLEKPHDPIAQRERNHEKAIQLIKFIRTSKRDLLFLETSSLIYLSVISAPVIGALAFKATDSGLYLILWSLYLLLTIFTFVSIFLAA